MSRVRDADHHVIVLDQSFRSEKLRLLYSKIQINTKILYYIRKIPELSLLLRDEEDLLLESFRNMNDYFYIPKEKRNDLEFMRKAVKVNYEIYPFYELLQNDKEATLSVVSQNSLYLQRSNFIDDFDVVYQAFIQDPFSCTVQSLLSATKEFKDWNDIRQRIEFTESFRKNLVKSIAENPLSIAGNDECFTEGLNENADIMMDSIKVNPLVFKYAHQSLRANKDFVIEALSCSGLLLDYVDISLNQDQDVIKTALRQNSYASKFLREDLKTKEILAEFPHSIEFFTSSFRSNLETMMQIVKVDGKLLKYAETTLKSDRNLVLEAVKQSGISIQYADPILLIDREIALAAVNQDGNSINYLYKYFSNDQEIMEKSIEIDGSYLRFCSIELRKNKQIVVNAVSKNGKSLRYASLQFQKDKDIVLLALKDNGLAIEFIHSSLWKEEDVVKAAGIYSARALYFASQKIKCNKDIVFPILCKHAAAYEYMDKSLKQDKDFLLDSIKRNWRVFEKSDKKFRSNEEFSRRALELNGRCFGFLDEKYRNIPEFVLMACGSNFECLSDFLCGNRKFSKDIDFIEQCVMRNGRLLSYFDIDALDDINVMKIVKLALKGAN